MSYPARAEVLGKYDKDRPELCYIERLVEKSGEIHSCQQDVLSCRGIGWDSITKGRYNTVNAWYENSFELLSLGSVSLMRLWLILNIENTS